ncbi:MAG TPA: hypothetical protein PK228_20175 [Saprospiraceae bacterium]|nr:hypothetical protein [Saprospiraceae bacterium]
MDLALVYNNSEQGINLKGKVERFCQSMAIDFTPMPPSAVTDYQQLCFSRSFVVVDVSMEGNYHQIYDILSHDFRINHVLFVSRTYAPENIFNLHRGGIPPYPFLHNADSEDLQWDNEDIINYIKTAIGNVLEMPDQTRITGKMGYRHYNEAVDKILTASYNHQREVNARKKRIFISYRSKYYNEANKLVAELRAKKWHAGDVDVILLRPGELTYENELLTEVRRWQIIGVLEDLIREAQELWVLESGDYLKSWWTVGELICSGYATYIYNLGEGWTSGPEIKAYNSQQQQLFEGTYCDRYRIPFNDALRAGVVGLTGFTNIHEIDLGMKKKRAMESIKKKFDFWSNFGLGRIYAMTNSYKDLVKVRLILFFLPRSMREQLSNFLKKQTFRFDMDSFKTYLHDARWTDAFWHDIQLYYSDHNLTDVTTGRVNPYTFLDVSGRVKAAVSPALVEEMIERKEQIMGADNNLYMIKRNPPRYLVDFKMKKDKLRAIPVYTLEKV